MSRENIAELNVVVCGPEMSGKTKLINSFEGHSYREQYVPTVGVDWSIQFSGRTRLKICDTEGNPRHSGSTPRALENVQLGIIVWDATNPDYKKVEELLAMIRQQVYGSISIPIIFVRTKSDLSTPEEFEAQTQEIKQKACAQGLKPEQYQIVDTSAKENKGMDQFKAAIDWGIGTYLNPPAAHSSAESQLELQEEEKEYEESRFAHTRAHRFSRLRNAEVNSAKDVQWLLLNWMSLNDPKSKTAKMIEEKIPDQVAALMKNFNGSIPSTLNRQEDLKLLTDSINVNQSFSESQLLDLTRSRRIKCAYQLLRYLAEEETSWISKISALFFSSDQRKEDRANIFAAAQSILNGEQVQNPEALPSTAKDILNAHLSPSLPRQHRPST